MTSQYIQWTIPSILYQIRRENPSVIKGLKSMCYDYCCDILLSNLKKTAESNF